jgi:hypothetical protein
LWGKDIPAGRVRAYSEKDAKESGFLVEEGHHLMDTFIVKG